VGGKRGQATRTHNMDKQTNKSTRSVLTVRVARCKRGVEFDVEEKEEEDDEEDEECWVSDEGLGAVGGRGRGGEYVKVGRRIRRHAYKNNQYRKQLSLGD
jgi:hypothetical protein